MRLTTCCYGNRDLRYAPKRCWLSGRVNGHLNDRYAAHFRRQFRGAVSGPAALGRRGQQADHAGLWTTLLHSLIAARHRDLATLLSRKTGMMALVPRSSRGRSSQLRPFGRKLLGGVFIAASSPIASHAGTEPKAKREGSPGAQIISGQHSPQGGAKGAAIAVDPKRRERSRLRPVLKATSICQLHQAGAL